MRISKNSHKRQRTRLYFLVTFIIYSIIPCRAVLVPWLDDDPFEATLLEMGDEPWSKDILSSTPPLHPSEVTEDNKSLKQRGNVPQYVIDNSPLLHLYSEEKYWPADVKDFVKRFQLRDHSGEKIINEHLRDLSDLQEYYSVELENGTWGRVSSEGTYMTSLDDFDKDPDWLLGEQPEYGTGHIKKAPAVLFVVDKGNGWVDAFWFYFYPFNWGPYIMGSGPWGNHVGDWEHSLVRFYKGEPQYLWMSAHGGGSAYKFEAIEKIKRLRRVDGKLTNEVIKKPLIFSARGTHAHYASVGQHAHDVPFFFMPLSDFTDRGPLWDPSLNYYAYTVTVGEKMTPCGAEETKMGLEWLSFKGAWGDKQLRPRDPRQKWCPFQWKYIDGPKGPLFKNMERVSLCQRFKWWNFWKGCPARRYIKRGEGLDAEKNDLVGDNCGILLYNIRPKWLRNILRFLTWRGSVCFIMDYFTG